jgi:hypothetical protein
VAVFECRPSTHGLELSNLCVPCPSRTGPVFSRTAGLPLCTHTVRKHGACPLRPVAAPLDRHQSLQPPCPRTCSHLVPPGMVRPQALDGRRAPLFHCRHAIHPPPANQRNLPSHPFEFLRQLPAAPTLKNHPPDPVATPLPTVVFLVGHPPAPFRPIRAHGSLPLPLRARPRPSHVARPPPWWCHRLGQPWPRTAAAPVLGPLGLGHQCHSILQPAVPFLHPGYNPALSPRQRRAPANPTPLTLAQTALDLRSLNAPS